MATEEFRVSALIAASPNRIYSAWMDERQHSAFTGGRATVDPWVGGRHTAWDNYVEGTLVELDTGRRIVMTWRTSEFPAHAHDSRVEVKLEPVAGGTRVTVHHSDIPQGQADQYKKGWRSQYLDPMKRYFGKPGAMRAALQAASKAGVLPIPGVTSARPGARVASRVEANGAVPSGKAEAAKKSTANAKPTASQKKTTANAKPAKEKVAKAKPAPKKKAAKKAAAKASKPAPKKKVAKAKPAPKKKVAKKAAAKASKPAPKKKVAKKAAAKGRSSATKGAAKKKTATKRKAAAKKRPAKASARKPAVRAKRASTPKRTSTKPAQRTMAKRATRTAARRSVKRR
jgi:uncharacterized protein YndB with AHSA1/START domain